MTQFFKGDATELKMIEAGRPPLDNCSAALSEFYSGAYETEPFLLMLYDAGRMPFGLRVPRSSFVNFIRQAIPNARFTGTFESYLFLIKSIFGETAEMLFDVPSSGVISMVINVAGSGLEFDFIGSDSDGEFTVETSDGEQLILNGISGITSEAELKQLLSELVPVGIFPDITLTFFLLSQFVAEDDLGDLYTMVDHLDNEIVFYETGA
jgi:hypothetical protein